MENLGLSGDTIIFYDDTVVKICETNQDRFAKNIEKQKLFKNQYINAVNILEHGLTSDNKNYIRMPLLKCNNCIDWLSTADINSINLFLNKINQYFTDLISNSTISNFDYHLYNNKLDELYSKILDIELQNIILQLKSITFSNQFLYGANHGDLTLTNLFISNQKDDIIIDTIDFLDTFIQSPINDIVKIRQDTFHLWTVKLLTNTDFDINRAIIVLGYIDKQISKIINNNNILQEYYLPFQIINLLRILPYNREETIFIFLKNEIRELFEHLNRDCSLRRKVASI